MVSEAHPSSFVDVSSSSTRLDPAAPYGDTVLYWFTTDLRLDDNRGLLDACGNQSHPVSRLLPVYLIDSDILSRNNSTTSNQTSIGNVTGPTPNAMRWGRNKSRHTSHCLRYLQETLRNTYCSDLLVKKGKPRVILQDLVSKYNVSKIIFTMPHRDELAYYEHTLQEIKRFVKDYAHQGIALVPISDRGLYSLSDLKCRSLSDLPNSFDQFMTRIEGLHPRPKPPLKTPESLPPLPYHVKEKQHTVSDLMQLFNHLSPTRGKESEAPLPQRYLERRGSILDGIERCTHDDISSGKKTKDSLSEKDKGALIICDECHAREALDRYLREEGRVTPFLRKNVLDVVGTYIDMGCISLRRILQIANKHGYDNRELRNSMGKDQYDDFSKQIVFSIQYDNFQSLYVEKHLRREDRKRRTRYRKNEDIKNRHVSMRSNEKDSTVFEG